MQKIHQIKGIAAVIEIDNIDTDQIIPAEHLKIISKGGLEKYLFSSWRYTSSGRLNPGFVLNQDATKSSKILITGENFGCGSSREHAAWALLDFGIQVIISSSIADIFHNNAIKNGLLPIVTSLHEQAYLMQQNAGEMCIDIEKQIIQMQDKTIDFEIEPFAKYCLLNGIDQLDFLLSHQDEIQQFEQQQMRYC